MSYDVDQIAGAIAGALENLSADGVGVQAVAAIPSNPTPSGVYVSDGAFDYDVANARGLDEFELIVTLLVGYGADLAAQRRLRKLRDGDAGVKALIEGVPNADGYPDKTLGGLVDHVRVTKASAPRLYGPESAKRPLGVEFTVQIRATP
jgi:hypothetical protein